MKQNSWPIILLVIVTLPFISQLSRFTSASHYTTAPGRMAQVTQVATDTHGVRLPLIAKQYRNTQQYPDYVLASKIWRAAERFIEAYPPAEFFPGYTPEAGGPSAENARANVESACHDFPDLPDIFGQGVHHATCYESGALYLGTYHAIRDWRSNVLGLPNETSVDNIAWAQHYLDVELDYLARFVYGPEDGPAGVGYRDSLAAVWQNPARAMGVTIFADLLRQQNALGEQRQARVEELLSGIARAWYAEFWETGIHPTTGISLTTRAAPEVKASSLAGHQVVSTNSYIFHWDADKGNTPAEEVAWMGAGVMLATRVLGDRLPDAEELYTAARHYVDFAVAYDRPDPVHGGTIRTLNAETTGGTYGQRQYWVENHAPDVPSIPYMGSTWHFIDVALLASSFGDQQPWPELTPDEVQWEVLLSGAEETLRAADGTFLVDFTLGRGIGFNLDRFPEWWSPCGQPGRPYVHYDGRAGGPELFVSETGHPAGFDLLLAGWPLMRIAAHREDAASYGIWDGRLNRVLDEYITHPPNPHWAACKNAPWVSDNPGYHWSNLLALYFVPYLGASGYHIEPWTP